MFVDPAGIICYAFSAVAELPEYQRSDTIHMLKKTNTDPLIGKRFPDEAWFSKRADESMKGL